MAWNWTGDSFGTGESNKQWVPTSAEASEYGASLQAGTAMANLAEQQRQFNQQQAAQQASAQAAQGGLVNLVNEYNRSYAEAKSGYEARYNQMLGIADATTNQQATDIRSQYAQQTASQMQSLQRTGMGNTTVGNTLALGTQGQQSQALNRLADQMQQTKLGIIGGYDATGKNWAPSQQALLAALQSGQQASGIYGGSLAGAMGGLTSGSTTPVVPLATGGSQSAASTPVSSGSGSAQPGPIVYNP